MNEKGSSPLAAAYAERKKRLGEGDEHQVVHPAKYEGAAESVIPDRFSREEVISFLNNLKSEHTLVQAPEGAIDEAEQQKMAWLPALIWQIENTSENDIARLRDLLQGLRHNAINYERK